MGICLPKKKIGISVPYLFYRNGKMEFLMYGSNPSFHFLYHTKILFHTQTKSIFNRNKLLIVKINISVISHKTILKIF